MTSITSFAFDSFDNHWVDGSANKKKSVRLSSCQSVVPSVTTSFTASTRARLFSFQSSGVFPTLHLDHILPHSDIGKSCQRVMTPDDIDSQASEFGQDFDIDFAELDRVFVGERSVGLVFAEDRPLAEFPTRFVVRSYELPDGCA